MRQKAGLNRGILRSGWGLLVRRLEEKAPPAGWRRSSPHFTSQRCSACGQVDGKSREGQAVFRCTACGFACNADVNAARNIAAGHAVTARGRSGLPGRANREPQLLASLSGREQLESPPTGRGGCQDENPAIAGFLGDISDFSSTSSTNTPRDVRCRGCDGAARPGRGTPPPAGQARAARAPPVERPRTDGVAPVRVPLQRSPAQQLVNQPMSRGQADFDRREISLSESARLLGPKASSTASSRRRRSCELPAHSPPMRNRAVPACSPRPWRHRLSRGIVDDFEAS